MIEFPPFSYELKFFLLFFVLTVGVPVTWHMRNDFALAALNSPEWRRATQARRRRNTLHFLGLFLVSAIIVSWPSSP